MVLIASVIAFPIAWSAMNMTLERFSVPCEFKPVDFWPLLLLLPY